LKPFVPLCPSAHFLTLAGNFWPRAIDEARFPTRAVLYPTEPGTQVLVHENRPPWKARGEVFLLHGLEGSSSSGYLVSLAQRLLCAGFAVHRVNMRSCGGTEHLTPTLYHSGLTADIRLLLERFRSENRGPRFLAGFSLGGNVTLKLLGELGASASPLLSGACAVSTPIDLHACVRRLDSPQNWIYEQKFIRSLRNRYRRRHLLDPGRFPIDGLEDVETIFDFDNRFTAPHFGFGDAPNYYATQSAIRFIPAIRLPTLLIQAMDDPMIPFDLFTSDPVRLNPAIRLLATPHGGHLGYIARSRPRFWLDETILEWIESHAGENPPGAGTTALSGSSFCSGAHS
jgi:predicted alpha/beta-fold hydrolase